MRNSSIIIVLAFVLACLGFTGGQSGWSMERPYEEGVVIVGCRDFANIMANHEYYWYEHPRLVPLIVFVLELAVGERISMLRSVWAVFSVISFAMACQCVAPTAQGSKCSSSLASTAVRFLLVFSVFASPLMLISSVRLGPGAISCLATVACIVSVKNYITARKKIYLIISIITCITLVLSNVYGVFAMLGLMVPLLIGSIFRKDHGLFRLSILNLSGCSLTIYCEKSLMLRLWRTTQDHYWAEPLLGNGPLAVPMARLWYPLTELAFDDRLIPALAQICVLLLLLRILAGGPDAISRWLASAALTSIALLWLAEYIAGHLIVVHHWLGWLAILSACAIARALSFRSVAAVTLVSTALILVPSLSSIAWPVGRGEQAIQRASAFLERKLGQSDRLVFGGSRAYMTIMPYIDRRAQNKATVYLRSSHPRDSFAGQNLIPPHLKVASESWQDFEFERSVVVEFEASQRILVPPIGSILEERREYVSNSLSIEQIIVEIRRRARDTF